jgi:hypothetical protein
MNSLPTIQDTPQSINSAIGTGNKSAGWIKGAMANPDVFTAVALCCVIGLFVTLNLIFVTLSLIFRFPSFQPSTDQIALLLG